MRYAKNECTDQQKMDEFLAQAKVGFLGMANENIPYVIPVNFVWRNGFIYFHGADTGRKNDMMAKNNHVCFTVGEDYGTIAHPVPANIGTVYMSVIISGTVEQVDLGEGTKAMQAMIDKYVPNYFDTPLSKTFIEKYRSGFGSKTTIFKITPTQLTAKACEADEAVLFFEGRSAKEDVGK